MFTLGKQLRPGNKYLKEHHIWRSAEQDLQVFFCHIHLEERALWCALRRGYYSDWLCGTGASSNRRSRVAGASQSSSCLRLARIGRVISHKLHPIPVLFKSPVHGSQPFMLPNDEDQGDPNLWAKLQTKICESSTSEKDIPAEVDRPAPRVKCRVSWRNLRLLKAATDSGFKTRGEILMSGGVTYQVFQTMCVTIVFMVFRTQWHSCVSAEQCPEQTDVLLPFYETGSSLYKYNAYSPRYSCSLKWVRKAGLRAQIGGKWVFEIGLGSPPQLLLFEGEDLPLPRLSQLFSYPRCLTQMCVFLAHSQYSGAILLQIIVHACLLESFLSHRPSSAASKVIS